jgi:hypothetical protein
MEYHQIPNIHDIPGKTWVPIILLAKLGFQEKDGIPNTSKTRNTSKNMEYHGIPAKYDILQRLSGDPIYIQILTLTGLHGSLKRNYRSSCHLLPQLTHSSSSQWAKIAWAKTFQRKTLTNSTHSSVRVHTREG